MLIFWGFNYNALVCGSKFRCRQNECTFRLKWYFIFLFKINIYRHYKNNCFLALFDFLLKRKHYFDKFFSWIYNLFFFHDFDFFQKLKFYSRKRTLNNLSIWKENKCINYVNLKFTSIYNIVSIIRDKEKFYIYHC